MNDHLKRTNQEEGVQVEFINHLVDALEHFDLEHLLLKSAAHQPIILAALAAFTLGRFATFAFTFGHFHMFVLLWEIIAASLGFAFPPYQPGLCRSCRSGRFVLVAV